MDAPRSDDPSVVLDRLMAATNAHDLDALVDCFAEGYVNETPAHPARSFVGREQVRRNWTSIFTAVPDVTAVVLRRAVQGSTVWAELQMRGTRRDGSPHLMSGVTISRVEDGRIGSMRFYVEPVVDDGLDADAAVRRATAGAASGPGD